MRELNNRTTLTSFYASKYIAGASSVFFLLLFLVDSLSLCSLSSRSQAFTVAFRFLFASAALFSLNVVRIRKNSLLGGTTTKEINVLVPLDFDSQDYVSRQTTILPASCIVHELRCTNQGSPSQIETYEQRERRKRAANLIYNRCLVSYNTTKYTRSSAQIYTHIASHRISKYSYTDLSPLPRLLNVPATSLISIAGGLNARDRKYNISR